MNHLAHAWLADGDPGLEVGGLLGDFVRGRPDPALPRPLRDGIALHRAIDSFTDAHAEVVAARRRFPPPWRRYAGILLDVWFDHCLARDFEGHASMPLADFSDRLRQRLRAAWPYLPPRLRGFLGYMQAHDLPAAYAEPAMIGNVLAGLSQRLSRRNPVADALPVLQARDAALEAHFRAFLPDLAAFAAAERARLQVPR